MVRYVRILRFQPAEHLENIGRARQLILNEQLLNKIAKLGENIIRKKSASTAVGVVSDRGTLSAVRAALGVFASHGMTSTLHIIMLY